MRTPEADGWANLPISAGFDWAQATGPYTWQKVGNADKLCGLGLPYPPLPWEGVMSWQGEYDEGRTLSEARAAGGVHVSFFGVWRCYDGEPVEPPPPELKGWRCIVARFLREMADWLCAEQQP